ncbi:hypothetical protein RI367_004249 [Sorochytrium milnesiophthora]
MSSDNIKGVLVLDSEYLPVRYLTHVLPHIRDDSVQEAQVSGARVLATKVADITLVLCV